MKIDEKIDNGDINIEEIKTNDKEAPKQNNSESATKEILELKKQIEDLKNEVKVHKSNEEEWKIKYELFARDMERKFQEKAGEFEVLSRQRYEKDKERLNKDVEEKIATNLNSVFRDIVDQVLTISTNVLRLGNNASPELVNYSKGFQMIVENLRNILVGRGLVIIEPKINDVFDHHKHEAISKEIRKNINTTDGIIIGVISPQYCLNGKTISYAKVKVAVRKG